MKPSTGRALTLLALAAGFDGGGLPDLGERADDRPWPDVYLRGAFWREVSDWSDFRFDLPDGRQAPDVRTAITAWAATRR